MSEYEEAIFARGDNPWWVYVNPLCAEYLCFLGRQQMLVVFESEEGGRQMETYIRAMESMVGHHIDDSELFEIIEDCELSGMFIITDFMAEKPELVRHTALEMVFQDKL